MYDIFDRLATSNLITFTENYETRYNRLEKFFPEMTANGEYIRINDYDVDYNPTAKAVADNTIAPLAQRPSFSSSVQTFINFKLEHRLTDRQIRIIQNARGDSEREEAIRMVLNDLARLYNSQMIARERLRAQALLTGKIEINENGHQEDPVDFGIPADQFADIDLAKDDILEKLFKINEEIINPRTHKNVATMLLSRQSLFKMAGNDSMRAAVLGSANKNTRRLTYDEVQQALSGYLNINYEVIHDGNNNDYQYSEDDGTQVSFIPKDKIILLPNIRLGATPIGNTSEGTALMQQDGIDVSTTNGITVFSNYEPRPTNYIMTTVQRFTVCYPKAYCSMVLTDKSA